VANLAVLGAKLAALTSFLELDTKIPASVMRNIKLMRYAVPTPIQANAMPLGLARHDLMCCAQVCLLVKCLLYEARLWFAVLFIFMTRPADGLWKDYRVPAANGGRLVQRQE
jgi:hypothetical protein